MPTLSERLFKLATENAGSYLVSLNLKAISKDRKRSPTDDPRAFYENLRKEAEDGPIFSKPVIEALHLCPVELQKHEVQWLATQYEAARKAKPSAKFPDVRELRGVLDYLHQETPNLDTLTWPEAVKNSAEWHKSFVKEVPMGKYETKDVVMEFDNGWSMVKVPTEHDLDVEGEFMGHCVGGDDYARKVSKGKCTIYSLRDPKNEPHVTIEVDETRKDYRPGRGGKPKEREVIQVQGKQNEAPVEKYHGMLEKFFVREGLHLQDKTYSYNKSPETHRAILSEEKWLSNAYRVAESKHLSPEVAEHLFEKIKPYLLMKEHSKDKASVREDRRSAWVAALNLCQNPLTPENILKSLADLDSDFDLETALVSNPSTPSDVLTQALSRHLRADVGGANSNALVLRAIASNPNLSDVGRKQLFTLAFGRVESKKPVWLSREDAETILCGVAANPKTPKATLEKFWGMQSISRNNLALAFMLNPSTPSSLLLRAISDKGVFFDRMSTDDVSDDSDLLEILLRNPNTTEDILLEAFRKKIVEDYDGTLSTLQKSPLYSDALLLKLLPVSESVRFDVTQMNPIPDVLFEGLLKQKDFKKIGYDRGDLELLVEGDNLTEDQIRAVVKKAGPSGWRLILEVLNQSKCPPDVLEEALSFALKTKNEELGNQILYNIVGSPNVTDSMLLRIVPSDYDLQDDIAHRKNLSLDVLNALVTAYERQIQRLEQSLAKARGSEATGLKVDIRDVKTSLKSLRNRIEEAEKSDTKTASPYLPLFALRGYQQ